MPGLRAAVQAHPDHRRLMNLQIEKNLRVSMRDGVTLATDVYRPAEVGRWPAIVMRLPYNKELPMLLFLAGDILRIAQAGYAIVVQDCRGTYQSDGVFDPFFQEGPDGADTIAWAAAQPWSTGEVGMMGASYYGATQWLAAAEGAPALRAMAPFITTDQYYDKWTYQGGAFQLGFILQWSTATFAVGEVVRQIGCGDAQGSDFADVVRSADAVDQQYWHLPLNDMPLLKQYAPYTLDWLNHAAYDDYWRAIAPSEKHGSLNVPALNFGGWYDLFLGGTLSNYTALKDRVPQKLVIGPWVHGYNGGFYPERAFGMLANDVVADVTADQVRWFDHWLKGQDNGVREEAPVKLFIMGDDVWREEQDWPLPDTDWQSWYLHSDGRAGIDIEDGHLDCNKPDGEPPDRFIYDPQHPVPTHGGASFLPGLFIAANAGPRDQRAVESRDDVLCYTSSVLTEPLEVTGPVRLVLYIQSSAPDTDFTGKLVDVYPDGRAFILTDGILRIRYRDGFDAPTLMNPGDTYRVDIDLVATANVFAAGHRIRLEISSSNFPRFDRNSNSGGDIAQESASEFVAAENVVLHDVAAPSHLILPVIRRA